MIVTILNHEGQISLTSLMGKQQGKVESENGGNEQGLMESTKIRRGNLEKVFPYKVAEHSFRVCSAVFIADARQCMHTKSVAHK